MSKEDSLGMWKKINHYSYCSTQSIGKGYSSFVYKGLDQLTDEEVAVKLIDMKNIKGDVHKTLLANEIEILKLLKNVQNIIEVYDIYNLKTHTCIITELCDGGDLAKRIKSRKMIPEAEAIGILKQIINGYRNMYKFGIVHRDLKPANIFFVNDTIKIADFGFAIKNSDLKKCSNYNVGSPVYMPLEALNENNYSTKSDVWAIGIIFYEMLTGKTPWKAKTQTDLKRQIKAFPIKGLLPNNISNESSQFLIKSLQLNQAMRMTPQEMDCHFSHINCDSDLIQKNAFSTSLATNKLFRTRAVSHDREERIDPNMVGKNIVTAPKTGRKISLLNGMTGNFGSNTNQTNYPSHLNKTNQREEGNKFQHLIRTTATLGIKTQSQIIDYKRIATNLISQIHFCRFLYKLIERIEMMHCVDKTDALKQVMSTIIDAKFKEIISLKSLSSKSAHLFKRTKEYEKIVGVIEQYSAKYERVLDWANGDQLPEALRSVAAMVNTEIEDLYEKIKDEETFNDQEKDQVILLDYLITLKQLAMLNLNNDLENFHEKSKIQTIVDGKPAKQITKEHIRAITEKLRAMKIIS